ncbi:tRNA-specific adenosine deaminase [Alphaproteobacteria bacterium SO-S41]|nr:tRNA-specific adenosine deaminase [Alphaproteobacteria bacterium SO-S41]
MTDPHDPMHLAMIAAEAAAARGEVPVGAVITGPDGAVLAQAGNRTLELKDPTAHAEILVIREAAQVLGNERLIGCDLHVSLEPCAMCAGAISFARIRKLHFAASDPKMGGVLHGGKLFEQPTCHHRPEVHQGHLAHASAELLRSFFRARRG